MKYATTRERLFIVGSHWMLHLIEKREMIDNPIPESDIEIFGHKSDGTPIYSLGIWDRGDFGWPIYSDSDDDFDVWNYMSSQPVWE